MRSKSTLHQYNSPISKKYKELVGRQAEGLNLHLPFMACHGHGHGECVDVGEGWREV